MPIQIAIFVIALWIIIILLIAFLCKRYFPKQEELSRKIIHIGIGPVILLAWLYDIPKNMLFNHGMGTLVRIQQSCCRPSRIQKKRESGL